MTVDKLTESDSLSTFHKARVNTKTVEYEVLIELRFELKNEQDSKNSAVPTPFNNFPFTFNNSKR